MPKFSSGSSVFFDFMFLSATKTDHSFLGLYSLALLKHFIKEAAS